MWRLDWIERIAGRVDLRRISCMQPRNLCTDFLCVRLKLVGLHCYAQPSLLASVSVFHSNWVLRESLKRRLAREFRPLECTNLVQVAVEEDRQTSSAETASGMVNWGRGAGRAPREEDQKTWEDKHHEG